MKLFHIQVLYQHGLSYTKSVIAYTEQHAVTIALTYAKEKGYTGEPTSINVREAE